MSADLQSAPFNHSGNPPENHSLTKPTSCLGFQFLTYVLAAKQHGQSQRRGSNPRPADYKSAALPTELRWPIPCRPRMWQAREGQSLAIPRNATRRNLPVRHFSAQNPQFSELKPGRKVRPRPAEGKKRAITARQPSAARHFPHRSHLISSFVTATPAKTSPKYHSLARQFAACLTSEFHRLLHASNLKSQISNLKSQISNLKSQISNLKSQISNLKSQISNLKSRHSPTPPAPLSAAPHHRRTTRWRPSTTRATGSRAGWFVARRCGAIVAAWADTYRR